MIPELRDLSYESRLLQCGLTTLETRRLRGDQIEVFKIMNGYEDVDRNMFFKLKEGSRTRGHKTHLPLLSPLYTKHLSKKLRVCILSIILHGSGSVTVIVRHNHPITGHKRSHI